MTETLYIGLSTIAILYLWDSYFLNEVLAIVPTVKQGVSRMGPTPLIYLLDCAYCKGFWLCLAGALIAGNTWLVWPSYGLVVLWLSGYGEPTDE